MRKLPEAERLRRDRASKRKWRLNNPEACAAQSRKWKAANPEKAKATSKRCKARRRKERTAYMRKWRSDNKNRLNAHARSRRRNDLQFRLSGVLRNRVRKALRRNAIISGRKIALIGCDVPFLIGYLEARFKGGMSWADYGKLWEIDHRIPCAEFDLRETHQQRTCFHYSNLQPLFCVDNKRKNATLPASHQAEMV